MNLNTIRNILFSYRLMGCLRAFWLSKRYRMSSAKACICRPLCFTAKYIYWGQKVTIFKNCRIEGVSNYEGITYQPKLRLGERVTIQQNAHITFADSIEIGSNTAIAANVTITDIDHPYHNPDIPVERQKLIVKPVFVGKDCKIYNNAVILQGTRIGNHCVVGANSVVKGNFPDYSIIVGCPARIVKRFNQETNSWEKTNPDGSFT